MEEEPKRTWRRPKKRHEKLGDKIEQILKPVVEIIDETLGTNLKDCEGCRKRKEWLNELDKKITD